MAYEALAYPTFQPAMRIITAITNAEQALVSTGSLTFPAGVITITPFDHQYIDGMIIRLMIPWYYGMQQANGVFGEITVVNSFQFLIDIDTSRFDAFVIPPIVLVPDPYAIGLTMPLRPYERLINSTIDPLTGAKIFVTPTAANDISIEEFAQAVPFAERTDMVTAAVRNVLPYP